MYDPFNERYDPKKESEAIRKKRNDLLAYLAHVNKPEHLATVTEMIDGLARLESTSSWLTEEHRGRQRGNGEYVQEGVMPNSKPQTIELPVGTRKVSIEL